MIKRGWMEWKLPTKRNIRFYPGHLIKLYASHPIHQSGQPSSRQQLRLKKRHKLTNKSDLLTEKGTAEPCRNRFCNDDKIYYPVLFLTHQKVSLKSIDRRSFVFFHQNAKDHESQLGLIKMNEILSTSQKKDEDVQCDISKRKNE